MELLCGGFAIFVFAVSFLIARRFANKNGDDNNKEN
jgi:hypothetical protein